MALENEIKPLYKFAGAVRKKKKTGREEGKKFFKNKICLSEFLINFWAARTHFSPAQTNALKCEL